MTEIQAWTNADLAYKIVLLKTLADLVLEEFKQAKAIMGEQIARGDSIAARTLDDRKLGKVTKSDPKPEAVVKDRDALDAWLRVEFPDKIETRVELGRLDEVLAVLIDAGRQDLIGQVEVVPDHLVGVAKAAALKGREVPGIEVVPGKPVVSARAELAAHYVVRELLSGAQVPLLGIEA
ncbi:hypothetical protein [Nocardia farcinica]|uniref:Uncharacterized protein n=1 Tax=Nocardia farcinica (strain IFM 10152) TaxID=247156 RepID=Q5YZR0_NOCFA|nr:hypothetical protein [Nocardia farcinica]BAD56331.1 hypothetical protein NFA_14860 [Nocardia farcinica IFM 10152]